MKVPFSLRVRCFIFGAVLGLFVIGAPFLSVRSYAAVSTDIFDNVKSTSYAEACAKFTESYVNAMRSTFLSVSGLDKSMGIDNVPENWWVQCGSDWATLALQPYKGVFYFIDPEDGQMYFDDTRASHHIHGGGGGRNRFTDKSQAVMDSGSLADMIDTVNSYYRPNEGLNYISWLSDPVYSTSHYHELSLFQDSNLFCGKGWTEVYLLGFARDGDDYYYSKYLYHFNLISDDNGDIIYNLFVYDYDYITHKFYTDTPFYTRSIGLSRASYPYLDINCPGAHNGHQYVSLYTTRSNWLKQSSTKVVNTYWAKHHLFSDTKGNDFDVDAFASSFCRTVPDKDLNKDVGFLVSDKPITMVAFQDIDTTHFPDNYYITTNGDTINQYTITNEAGDTTTIQKFIENNYTINITIGGGGSSGGGTTNNWDIDFPDFISNISNSISTSITTTFNTLFVPSDDFMLNKNIEFQDMINQKIPFMNDIDDLFKSLFVELEFYQGGNSELDTTYYPYPLPVWEFSVDFFGKRIDLVYLDFNKFEDILHYVRLVVFVFTYTAYIYHLWKYLPVLIANVPELNTKSEKGNGVQK